MRGRSSGPEPMTPTQVLRERMNGLARRANWQRLIVSLVLTAGLTLGLFGAVLGAGVVDGSSMAPAFQDRDIVLFNRLAKCGRGDVVILEAEGAKVRGATVRKYVKRVAGVPGDTVNIDETGVSINGKLLEETRAVGATRETGPLQYPMTLGADEYFVLGDNREHSMDSRSFGAVKDVQLEGKVITILRTRNINGRK